MRSLSLGIVVLVARCAQILGPPGLAAASASQNVVQNLPALLLGQILPKAQLGGLLFQWDATTTGGGAALGWEKESVPTHPKSNSKQRL